MLDNLLNTAKPGSPKHEQQKMEIFVKSLDDLRLSITSFEKSMISNAESSDKLSRKVYYLNFIITVATIIGTIIALIKIFG